MLSYNKIVIVMRSSEIDIFKNGEDKMISEQKAVEMARDAASSLFPYLDLDFVSTYWDWEADDWVVKILIGGDLLTAWEVGEGYDGAPFANQICMFLNGQELLPIK